MSRVQQLYQLQSLDSEIDKIQQQLTEIAAKLDKSDTLRQAKTAAETAEAALRKAQANTRDLTLEVKTLTDKIAAQEKTLYGGKAFSAKEAANLQDEIASLKRRYSQREEALLEAMVETEEQEQILEQAKQELLTIQQEWQAEQETFSQTQSALKTKLNELKAHRLVIAQVVAEDDLDEYEDLRSKKAGRAMAMVKDGICQGCGVAASNNKIQQARTGAEIFYCSTCGRILYVL